jgi:hypothetical protein
MQIGKNIPNNYKIYQLARKVYRHRRLQDPPKFTQTGIFGVKICMPAGNPARLLSLPKKTFFSLMTSSFFAANMSVL